MTKDSSRTWSNIESGNVPFLTVKQTKPKDRIEGIESLILKKKTKKLRNFAFVIQLSRLYCNLKNLKVNMTLSMAALLLCGKGEKNKYFLGLENSRNKKNCIRKLINNQGRVVTNSKAIMAELKGFY